MADLHKELLEEQLGDAVLALLMDEYAEAQGKALLQQADLEMPEELQNACRSQIQSVYNKTEKSALLRRTVYRAAKTAAIIAVCLILSMNLILSVEAIRVPFLNFCIRTQKCFSSLTFSAPKDTDPDSDKDVVNLPLSVPKGYSIFHKEHNHEDYNYIYEDSILFLAYQNPEGSYFMFQTLPAEGSLSIDTENAEATEFLLNGMQAIQICQEDEHTFRTIWVDHSRQRLFDVSSNGMTEEDFKQHILDLSAMLMAPELYAD